MKYLYLLNPSICSGALVYDKLDLGDKTIVSFSDPRHHGLFFNETPADKEALNRLCFFEDFSAQYCIWPKGVAK
ncbi:MAG: hypothetical protein H6510_18030 [Acidobacteria bacterium]|nr:hypothetical protein [Acidobacteriota bacterium]